MFAREVVFIFCLQFSERSTCIQPKNKYFATACPFSCLTQLTQSYKTGKF